METFAKRGGRRGGFLSPQGCCGRTAAVHRGPRLSRLASLAPWASSRSPSLTSLMLPPPLSLPPCCYLPVTFSLSPFVSLDTHLFRCPFQNHMLPLSAATLPLCLCPHTSASTHALLFRCPCFSLLSHTFPTLTASRLLLQTNTSNRLITHATGLCDAVSHATIDQAGRCRFALVLVLGTLPFGAV